MLENTGISLRQLRWRNFPIYFSRVVEFALYVSKIKLDTWTTITKPEPSEAGYVPSAMLDSDFLMTTRTYCSQQRST